MNEVINSKFRQIEDLNDKKISIAILSSTVLLTIQFFLLMIFNLIDTQSGSILQTGTKVLVAIIFAYTFPIVWKEQKWKIFFVYFVSIFIFLNHYLFFSQNRGYIEELIFPFFFMCLPMFVYALTVKNWLVLKEIMKKASVIVFVCGFILSLLIFMGMVKIDSYSMAFSYYMLLPTIIFLDELIERLSIPALFISSISILSILAVGSRGPVLCIAVFIVLKLIKPSVYLRLSKIKMYLIFIFVTFSIFVMINLQSILLFLYKWLQQFGLNSRSIILFLSEEVHLSGRASLYDEVLSEIVRHPIEGIGIAGDRRLLNGAYVHNIFLELLANFGVLIGMIVIIFLVAMIISIFFVKSELTYNMLIIWVSLGFVSLFVSGSYLIDTGFWTFLGLLMSSFFLKGNERTVLKKL